mmetsp:Transcript_4749/g.16697  ORF Transcript_4749/g.16697 Transcript_4749/m.16697 type:complete len:395 (+) Transcript_4749:2181-3365(+)
MARLVYRRLEVLPVGGGHIRQRGVVVAEELVLPASFLARHHVHRHALPLDGRPLPSVRLCCFHAQLGDELEDDPPALAGAEAEEKESDAGLGEEGIGVAGRTPVGEPEELGSTEEQALHLLPPALKRAEEEGEVGERQRSYAVAVPHAARVELLHRQVTEERRQRAPPAVRPRLMLRRHLAHQHPPGDEERHRKAPLVRPRAVRPRARRQLLPRLARFSRPEDLPEQLARDAQALGLGLVESLDVLLEDADCLLEAVMCERSFGLSLLEDAQCARLLRGGDVVELGALQHVAEACDCMVHLPLARELFGHVRDEHLYTGAAARLQEAKGVLFLLPDPEFVGGEVGLNGGDRRRRFPPHVGEGEKRLCSVPRGLLAYLCRLLLLLCHLLAPCLPR